MAQDDQPSASDLDGGAKCRSARQRRRLSRSHSDFASSRRVLDHRRSMRGGVDPVGRGHGLVLLRTAKAPQRPRGTVKLACPSVSQRTPNRDETLPLRRGRLIARVVFDPSKKLDVARRAPLVKIPRRIGLGDFDHAVVRNLESAVRDEGCSGAVDQPDTKSTGHARTLTDERRLGQRSYA
jgi:hypothetical protein